MTRYISWYNRLMFDFKQIQGDFPILKRQVHGKPLVYLDNSATSQKPLQVIDAMRDYYTQHNANVHRGVHLLSDESTLAWEQSRKTIAEFFGAQAEELILTRNTTESLNGVAYGWADHQLRAGEVILTSLLEHHSNFVVWQQVARRTGARVEYLHLTETGHIDLDDLETKLSTGKVGLISLAHVSNALGSVTDLERLVALVKAHGSTGGGTRPKIVLDGAQAAPHLPVDFAKLGVDFYAASGHKLLGPMGSGILLVKKALLESGEMQPWFFGGGMIAEVGTKTTTFNENLADRFTPGTPDVASAVGLATACTYLTKLGMKQVAAHDLELVTYALEQLQQIPEITILGPSEAGSVTKPKRIGSVTFLYQGVHAHDVAQILDSEGVAVRSGQHCTMPLHTQNQWLATTRASFQIYNSKADIDALILALAKVKKVFN